LIAVKTTTGNTNPIEALPNIQFIFVFWINLIWSAFVTYILVKRYF
jgi:hypothetical protein